MTSSPEQKEGIRPKQTIAGRFLFPFNFLPEAGLGGGTFQSVLLGVWSVLSIPTLRLALFHDGATKL